MAVIQETVTSFPDLVAKVLEISRGLPEDNFLWFRGISQESHRLLPKIMRDEKTAEEVQEREERLLTRFRQRSVAYWKEGYGQDEWDHLFAMQHYGFPTRLLDWSENLMVAAFFALYGRQGGYHDQACRPSIWCLDPVAWNRATPSLSGFGESIHVLNTANEESDNYKPFTVKKRIKYPVAIFGSHNSTRIVAQRGTFFVWGNDVRSLESFAEDEVQCSAWKIRLDLDPGELFKDVQSLGFTETMIFPEMGYLAEELSRMEGWRE